MKTQPVRPKNPNSRDSQTLETTLVTHRIMLMLASTCSATFLGVMSPYPVPVVCMAFFLHASAQAFGMRSVKMQAMGFGCWESIIIHEVRHRCNRKGMHTYIHGILAWGAGNISTVCGQATLLPQQAWLHKLSSGRSRL